MNKDEFFQKSMDSLLNRIKSNDKKIEIYQETDFQKQEFLGKGRFEVFRGTFKDKLVALKEIPLSNAFSDEQALIQEIDMCTIMEHDRVPTFYGVCITQKYVIMIMDLIINATTLAEKAEKQDYKTKIDYIVQLTKIIEDFHNHGIIHRDLKPLNIIVNDKNQVFLIDFGTSKFCSGSSTGTYDAKGTTYYMPPENVDFNEDDDGSSGNEEDNECGESEDKDDKKKAPFRISKQFDIWSLGCIISEICSGIKPWSNFDYNLPENKKPGIKQRKVIDTLIVMDFLYAQVNFPVPSELDPKLKDILKLCFKINPKERSTITELHMHLKNYYESL